MSCLSSEISEHSNRVLKIHFSDFNVDLIFCDILKVILG